MSAIENLIFEISDWRVDVLARTLIKAETSHQVSAKVMAVLVHLARHHDRLVTRQELIDEVWDGNTFVGEKSLNNAIWRLRQVLGDHSDEPVYIKTTSKAGYQLVPVPNIIAPDEPGTEKPAASLNRLFRPAIIGLLASGVAVLLIAALKKESPSLPTGDTAAKKLTRLPGRELDPAPSPDGSKFAFQYLDVGGHSSIYIQSLESPEQPAVRVTQGDSYYNSPAWAPDSRHLAFLISSQTEDCEILLQDMESGDPIAIGTCSHIGYSTLSWSPDGKWLVYKGSEPGVRPGLYLKAMGEDYRPVPSVKDRRISCVDCPFSDEEVSWSADSQSLAVTRIKNRTSNIYQYWLNEDRFERLTSGQTVIKGHTWSKNGQHLLYAAYSNPGDRRMWVLDLETKHTRMIGYPNSGFPTYLPDYRSILFYQRLIDPYIAALEIDKTEITQFPIPVIQTSAADSNPVYSGAANKLAYSSNLSGYQEIWIADTDGSNQQQITHLNSVADNPYWCSDGKKIAYIAFDADTETNSISIYDLAAAKATTLTTGFSNHGPPTWSRDDKSLLVPIGYGSDTELWRITLDGSRHIRIAGNGANFGRESADGRFIYFSREGSPYLYRTPTGGGSEELVIDDLTVIGGEVVGNWDLSGPDELIYSRRGSGEFDELVRFHIPSREREVLLTYPRRTISPTGMLSYSSSGQTLYFTHLEQAQIDISIAPDPLAPRSGTP